MNETQVIDFETLSECLEELNSTLEAAEAHGLLCGYICGGSGEHDFIWQQSILDDDSSLESMGTPPADYLIFLYQQTHIQLCAFDMDFEPLLPNDELPLTIRLQALKQWCQGFLAGLGLTGAAITQSEEALEVINDLNEIANVSEGNLNLDETEEDAYLNLAEHVRMACIFLHSILNQPNQQTILH